MNDSSERVYLPGLNGLRAIAALSVVMSHITIALPEFGYSRGNGWGFAAHGVTLFFTISGFLITYLLLLEKSRQNIDIKKFYQRRVLRIWPLYYLYLTIAILCLIIYSKYNSQPILYYIFFCANIPFIFGGSLFLIAHLWSIGVEEQFYLFWPLFIKLTKKMSLLITLGIVLFLVSLKFLARYFFNSEIFRTFLDVNRFECMLIGAIGAMLFYNKNVFFKRIMIHTYLQICAWLILILMALGKINTPGPTEHLLMSGVTLILIMGQVGSKNSFLSLENKVFDFMGKISYGLYVIHPLIVFLLAKVFYSVNINLRLKEVIIYLSVLLLTILSAHFSYKYFESPFLRLKGRLAIIKSQSSKY
jgi:peptidoglycan/LPS O-acetylase OafA/YrhL